MSRVLSVRLRFCATAVSLFLVIALAGCTTGMGAVVQSARLLWQRQDTTGAVPLDPKFEYLRVTRGSHTGLLWRGSTERTAAGVVEVFYSGSGEVVRVLDGRIVGALGLTTEWRQVSVAAPRWDAVANAQETASYERLRDVMPGYRTGVRDELVLRAVEAPRRSSLVGIEPATLRWFEETLRPRGLSLFRSSAEVLPPARYAVDFSKEQPLVVYGEQCLAADLCFTWQRWSTAMQQAQAAPR